MEYTNDIDISQYIFLRDADIASDMNGNTIAGITIQKNGIPAFDLFKNKYNELSTYDKNLSAYLKNNVDISIDNLSTLLNKNILSTDNLSNFVSNMYIDLSNTDKDISTKLNDDIKNKYDELSTYDKNLSTYLKNNVDISIDNLSTLLNKNILNINELSNNSILNDKFLSDEISTKIWIKDINSESDEQFKIGKYSDLSVIKIKKDDYDEKIKNNQILNSNVLYITDSDYIDAYGQQLKNLAKPTQLSDATTKQYVDESIETLNNTINNTLVDINLSIDTDNKHISKIQNYVNTLSSTDITNLGTIPRIELSVNNISSLVNLSIDNVSKDINILSKQISNSAQFKDKIHINKYNPEWYTEYNNNDLSSIFKYYSLDIKSQGTVKNGTIYKVEFTDQNGFSYDDPIFAADQEFIATTSNNGKFILKHGDILIVKTPNNEPTINISELNSTTLISLNPVCISDIGKKVINNISSSVWLSGNNNSDTIYNIGILCSDNKPQYITQKGHAISGNNEFLGINYFENISLSNGNISVDNILVDWNNLKDKITQKTLTNLSTELSNAIKSEVSRATGAENQLTTKTNQLDSSVDELTANVNTLNTTVDGLTTNVNTLNTTVDGLTTKTNNIKNAFNALSNINSDSQLHDVINALTAIYTALTAI